MSSWTKELDAAAILATKRGYWHILLFYLLCGLAAIPTSFLVFSTIFINATPEHWCALHPRLEELGLNVQLIRNLTVPRDHGVFESCKSYAIDPDEFFAVYENIYNETIDYNADLELNAGITDAELINVINASRSTEPSECKHGWIFSKTLYKKTLVTEYSLVCDNDWLPRTANALFWVGSIVGNLFFGWISDRYGRRPTILLMIFLLVPISIGSSYPGSYRNYIVLRIIAGLFFPAMYQLPLILALELMPPSKRTDAGIVIGMLFAAGMCLLSVIAYLLRDWFYLSLATTVPFIFTYGYFWLIPESPRWLVGRGRIADAEKVLRNLANKNGITLPRGFLLDLHKRIKDEELQILSNGTLKHYSENFETEDHSDTRLCKFVSLKSETPRVDNGEGEIMGHMESEREIEAGETNNSMTGYESHEVESQNVTDPFLKKQISTLRRKSIQIVNRILSNEHDENILENKIMDEQNSEGDCEASPLDIFRYPNLRKKFFILTFNWVSLGIAYNSLSYNTPNLGVDDYLAFFIGGAVELPSYVIAWHSIERYGRRWVFFSFMVIGGTACLFCVLVPEEWPWITVSLAMLGRLSAAAAFAVFYVQIGELLPTVLRAQAMGAASFISGIGLLACPYIVYLAVLHKWLPLIIIGTLSVAAGFASLFLPESLNQPLPQTIGDGERFGRNFKMFSCTQEAADETEP